MAGRRRDTAYREPMEVNIVMAKTTPSTRRVRFLVDRTVYDHNGNPVDEFHKGKTYTLPIASCERWILRRAAEYVDDDKPNPTPAKKPANVAKETASDVAKEKVGKG